MSSFIGSSISGIYIDDTKVQIISNSNNALQLQTANTTVDFGGYDFDNIGQIAQDLDLGTNKVVNLADATTATDALNRQTGDNRYYLNTTTLDSIVAPTAAVSLNSQKITNLANAVASTDAMTLGQDLRTQWLYGYLSADITSGLTSSYVVKFTNTQGPNTLTPSVTNDVTYSSSSGLFSLAAAKYFIAFNVEVEYTSGVNVPAIAEIVGSVDGTIKSLTTIRAPALGVKQLSQCSFVYNCASAQDISLSLTLNTSRIAAIGTGTNLFIQRLF